MLTTKLEFDERMIHREKSCDMIIHREEQIKMETWKVEDTKFDIRCFGDYGATIAWAEDFVYALESRPQIFKRLFKLAIGKYAWREFVGMVETLIQCGGHLPKNVGYSLSNMDYHKERPELWRMK